MQFSTLPNKSLEHLTEGAKLLEADRHGPKVYQLRDGSILKIFRRKRLFSSAFFHPYSERFCINATALKERGVPTITPLAAYQLENPALTAVHYNPLPGETLSTLIRQPRSLEKNILLKLANFINQLHDRGIYFRSLHPGNIILTPNGSFGLIDIADMRILRKPVKRNLAKRNREHFEKYIKKEKLPFNTKLLWETCNHLRGDQ